MTARLMRVFVRPRSKSEEVQHPQGRTARPAPEAIASGVPSTPEHDLRFRGGHTIAQLKFLNVYVGGGASWPQSDMDSIDTALNHAMSDPRLNNVMRQYFGNQPISSTFLGRQLTGTKRPKKVTEAGAKKLVKALFNGGQLSGLDFPSTVVNLLLPSGTVLTLGGPNEHAEDEDGHARNPGVPDAEEDSSLHGLGGYHGHASVSGHRIYFAIGVYSQILPNGKENGIVVFDTPWKNVVATFYHELNEARTDPDVDEAIQTGHVDGIIGWNSDQGEECGDFPVFEAGSLGDLRLVFQEVALAGGGTAPVQFQYSNAVHGPEGPIASPHVVHAAHEIAEATADVVAS